MSLMKRLIGKKNREKEKTAEEKVNEAIQGIRTHQRQLEKTKTHLGKQVTKLTIEAKECLRNKNRQGAAMKLKMKKQYQTRIQNIDNQCFNLDMQILALDESIMNQQTLQALEKARDVMKNTVSDEMIEKAGDIQDDLAQYMDDAAEFTSILSQPMGMLATMDDSEFEQELMDLELEQEEEEMFKAQVHMKRQPQRQTEQKKIEIESRQPQVQQEEEEEEELNMDSELKGELAKLEMELLTSAAPDFVEDDAIQDTRQRVQVSFATQGVLAFG